MTKIVLITPILQHYRLTFYEKLSKANDNYDFCIFYGYKKKEDGRPGYEGKTKFVSYGFKEFKFRILHFDVVYNLGMFRAIKKINPEVVIMQGIAGDLTNRRIISWAHRREKKIIIWACGWEPGRAKGKLLRFKNHLVSSFFSKANYFLTYSTNASNYVRKMGISKSIIETCYNGIETDEMEQNANNINIQAKKIRKNFQLDDYITFLYVGGLITEKRLDLLINAFITLRKKYDHIKLLIIGDGPLREKIEKKLEKNRDANIRYLGRIIDNVEAYFAATDCFVLPGIGGLALNQAMYLKKTCIVSQADGTEDDLVIEKYSGYRFIKDDMESLTLAMEKRIQEDPVIIKEMSENAHRIITEKSNVNNMVVHFVNGIDRLLSS